jgi:hypothetical protein
MRQANPASRGAAWFPPLHPAPPQGHRERCMTAPTIKSASVRIAYSSSDGYRAETGFGSNRAPTPQAAMLDAIDELARILALFGFGDDAQAAVSDACSRVKADREVKDATLFDDDNAALMNERDVKAMGGAA